MERAARLRINLLSELSATYDGRPLDLGGRRQRAVLARLLLARGEVVPADRLADAVWGDGPLPMAATSGGLTTGHGLGQKVPGRRFRGDI
ncbi:AfsR/SARP family transcriptional regulator [Nocardioides pakistanensis]